MDGKQGGDPATLADDLVRLAALDDPPPALTPSNCSRSRPGPCSLKPTPTATSPPVSPTTSSDPLVVPRFRTHCRRHMSVGEADGPRIITVRASPSWLETAGCCTTWRRLAAD
jgi:hypothetical protein